MPCMQHATSQQQVEDVKVVVSYPVRGYLQFSIRKMMAYFEPQALAPSQNNSMNKPYVTSSVNISSNEVNGEKITSYSCLFWIALFTLLYRL